MKAGRTGSALLWLASSSPRRRAILRELGFEFRLLRPGPDLPLSAGPTDPVAYAIANARHKALTAAHDVNDGLVIGCDTIVHLRNRVLGKPAGAVDAHQILEFLSGRTHRVISGIAVATRPGRRVFVSNSMRFMPIQGAQKILG